MSHADRLVRLVALTLCALAGLVGAGQAGEVSRAGLVGLWDFSDGQGVALADRSGNGNVATEIYPQDGTPRWGSGDFAGTLLLTATSNNFISVPPSPTLNSVTKAITVVVTVYPRDLWNPSWKKTGYTVLAQRQWRTERHPDQFYLGYEIDYHVLAYKWHVGLTDGQDVWVDAPAHGVFRPKVGQWVQVTGTYDSATGVAALYVNGVLAGTAIGQGSIRLDAESLGRPLVFGGELNRANVLDTDGEFNGYFDEARVYGRALSGEEIAELAKESGRVGH